MSKYRNMRVLDVAAECVAEYAKVAGCSATTALNDVLLYLMAPEKLGVRAALAEAVLTKMGVAVPRACATAQPRA